MKNFLPVLTLLAVASVGASAADIVDTAVSADRRQLYLWVDDNYFSRSTTTTL